MIFGLLVYCVVGGVCVFIGHITEDRGCPFVNGMGEAAGAFFLWPFVLLPLISFRLAKRYRKFRKDNHRK